MTFLSTIHLTYNTGRTIFNASKHLTGDDKSRYPSNDNRVKDRSSEGEGLARAHVFAANSASKFLKSLHLLFAIMSLVLTFGLEQIVNTS